MSGYYGMGFAKTGDHCGYCGSIFAHDMAEDGAYETQRRVVVDLDKLIAAIDEMPDGFSRLAMVEYIDGLDAE